MEALLDLVKNILIIWGVMIVAALGTIAFNTLREYLKVKLGKENFDSLMGFANTVVHYVEQIAKLEGLTSEEKKEKAVIWLSDILSEKGIVVSDEVIDMAIEAAVNMMNSLSGKTFLPEG